MRIDNTTTLKELGIITFPEEEVEREGGKTLTFKKGLIELKIRI